jgi:hypothetical protein
MIKNWSAESIESQLRNIYWACSDPRMDGFTTWCYKQDLYRVKFLVDELLDKCPSFSDEEEWLRDQEAEKIVQILKK